MPKKADKWELKMHEQRELKKQGAAVLYRRVKLLVECFESADFRAWCEENGQNDLDYMDRELEDTAANFMTLKSVLHAYCDEASWVKHNIRDLIAEVIELQKRDRTSERISWKERCLAAEKECERLRGIDLAKDNELANLKELLGICNTAKR